MSNIEKLKELIEDFKSKNHFEILDDIEKNKKVEILQSNIPSLQERIEALEEAVLELAGGIE